MRTPGPRDYTAGTEHALFAYSAATCYYPECDEPVVKMVDGEPVTNVEIAHIRGAQPGASRYDPSMSDDERRGFANLLLLCPPHHRVIDRLHPDDYPVDRLAEWKTAREKAAGIDSSVLGRLDDEKLLTMIEDAVAAAGPQRRVSAEIGIGFRMGWTIVSLPTATAVNFFGHYSRMGASPAITLTTRNIGSLPVQITTRAIRFLPCDAAHLVPTANAQLEVGAADGFAFPYDDIVTMIRFFRSHGEVVQSLRGEVTLGSGEIVKSPLLETSHLGIDDELPS